MAYDNQIISIDHAEPIIMRVIESYNLHDFLKPGEDYLTLS